VPWGGHEGKEVWAPYLSHAVHAARHENTVKGMALASLLDRVGRFQTRMGQYAAAEVSHRQVSSLRREVLGPEHPDMLTSVYCLTHILSTTRRYNESLALYKRACAGYETVLGRDHSTTGACHEHYAKTLASAQQDQPSLSPKIADSSASMRKGKESKLLRRLAKTGISSSKWSAR
jgi:hypothetical protein